jgi:cell division protein FtsL
MGAHRVKTKWFQIAALVVIAVLAVALYSSKTDAMRSRAHVNAMKAEIAETRADIRALEAEVAMLESPARVEALAREYLTLEPGAAARAEAVSNLPAEVPVRAGDRLLGQPEARR